MGVLRRRIETFAGYVVSAQLALEPGEPDILWAYWVMRTQNRTQAEAIQEMIQSMADAPGLRAGHILEEIGKPAVPALIQAVTAPPLGQRPELAQGGAALILGNLRAVEAVSVLRNLLNTGSDSNRTIAAVSLGKIGDKSALDDLIRAVEDPDYEVRFSAISALGELKDARAETRLLRLARETQDGNLRFIAVGSLGKCGTSAILPALNDLLSSETEASIRAEIQSAINAISSR
jgi:HEAT repeat protein